MNMERVKLYKGDCIDVMRKMDSESVDLVVTSPPYDNMRTYEGTCEWNFEIFQKVANELYRIVKDSGVVVWVVGDATIDGSESGTSFKQALYFKDIGFNIHDTMIWKKKSPMPRDTRIPRYWQAFEYMFVFSKGRVGHINFLREPTLNGGEKRNFYSRNADGSLRLDRKDKTDGHIVNETKPRHNVWEYASQLVKGHPAPFPEMLAYDHIISWSNEGDVVMDCFMGSGTTGKMALKANRRFIGIEKVDEYFELAKQRIEEENNNLILF
jgi:site-specific DNA-methyltransferase (adenine-specific)